MSDSMVVLVSQSYCNKLALTGWLERTEIYYFTFLEVQIFKSRRVGFSECSKGEFIS